MAFLSARFALTCEGRWLVEIVARLAALVILGVIGLLGLLLYFYMVVSSGQSHLQMEFTSLYPSLSAYHLIDLSQPAPKRGTD